MSGPAHLNEYLIDRLRIGREFVEREIETQRAEAARREELYRRGKAAIEFGGKSVVVVDDGVATGATLVAVLVAVPVGPQETLGALQREADAVVCPLAPRRFSAVGEFYEDFRQTTDEDVLALLGR